MQYCINQSETSSLKTNPIQSQRRTKPDAQEDDIHLTQSSLVQNAINQNDPKPIDRLIPYLDAYTINKWYKTNQNPEKETFNSRYTLLHWACEQGYLKIVQKLFAHQSLNLGCLNLEDNLSDTPLYLALRNAYKDNCIDNMNANTMNQGVMEPLMYSNQPHNYKTPFQRILQFKTHNNYLQIINLLLQHTEINEHKQDSKIGSPLHYAILVGDELLIDMFLKCPKIDLHSVNKHQSTLAHLLVSRNNPKILKFVFKHHTTTTLFSEQITSQDLDGHTPFDLAVIQFIEAKEPKFKKSSGILLEFLLKWAWDHHIPILFKNGDAVFHKVIQRSSLKLFELLCYSTKPYVTEQLNLRNRQGLTPLGLAIKKYGQKNLDPITECKLETIINILLDEYTIQVPSMEVRNGNNELHSIVMLHSKNELSDDQNIFLKKNATKLRDTAFHLVNGVNNKYETPLHIALNQGNLAMTKLLLNSTNFSIKDSDGNNVLHLVVSNLGILELFLHRIQNGKMDINHDSFKQKFFHHKNKAGQTAFNLLLQRVDNLFSHNPNDAKIAQYMKCIYQLENYYTPGHSIIDKLQDEIIQRIEPTDSEALNQEKCAICIDYLQPIENRNKVLQAYCGHCFHEWCLVGLSYWHSNKQNRQESFPCPLCRSSI